MIELSRKTSTFFANPWGTA